MQILKRKQISPRHEKKRRNQSSPKSTKKARERIMLELDEKLVEKENLFRITNKREMNNYEKKQLINRIANTLFFQYSNQTVNLKQNNCENSEFYISELIEINDVYKFNPKIDIVLETDFLKRLNTYHKVKGVLIDEIASIYLEDFIEFLLVNYNCNLYAKKTIKNLVKVN